MQLVLLPWIALVIGVILWAFAPDSLPRIREAGRILFAIGAFWIVAGNHGVAITIR